VIQAMLLMPADMTTMPVSHSAFIPTNPVIPTVQPMRFMPADIPVSHFMPDTTILVIQTMIHFRPARVMFCKTAILCHGNICHTKKSCQKSGD
jgi:hypothetical protein